MLAQVLNALFDFVVLVLVANIPVLIITVLGLLLSYLLMVSGGCVGVALGIVGIFVTSLFALFAYYAIVAYSAMEMAVSLFGHGNPQLIIMLTVTWTFIYVSGTSGILTKLTSKTGSKK